MSDDTDVVVYDLAPAPEPPEAHEDGMRVLRILDQYDPAARLRMLGAILTTQFGLLLAYESIADRDSEVEALFNHVRARLAQRPDGQALH
jgi:hypothetical protein